MGYHTTAAVRSYYPTLYACFHHRSRAPPSGPAPVGRKSTSQKRSWSFPPSSRSTVSTQHPGTTCWSSYHVHEAEDCCRKALPTPRSPNVPKKVSDVNSRTEKDTRTQHTSRGTTPFIPSYSRETQRNKISPSLGEK
jgi:hypothetical protein